MQFFYTILNVTYFELFLFMLVSFCIGYFLKPNKVNLKKRDTDKEKASQRKTSKEDLSLQKQDTVMQNNPPELRVIKTRERGGEASNLK